MNSHEQHVATTTLDSADVEHEILYAGTDLIVVGIDGSGCSVHAARWAAQEAERRSGALLLVHGYCLPAAGYSGYNPFPARLLTDLREDGGAMLQDAAALLSRAHPSLDISTRMVYGDPATVLRHAAGGALLTVVGAHGSNRIRVALGSVAGSVAAANPTPVAVIHPDDPPVDGPVVVGVDGSPTSEAAIAFAFESAELLGAPLIAVHSWTDRNLDGPMISSMAVVVDPERIARCESILLAERLAGWAEKFPDVSVRPSVVHELPTPALLEYARTARLIVVGSRGHSQIGGLLLGRTSQALIARSTSPVVVVRPRTTD